MIIALISAAITQQMCQVYKMIFHFFKTKKLSLKPYFYSGNMPSAHTAFVISFTTSAGLIKGFASEVFSVSLVFSLIVIHDALRVRKSIEYISLVIREQFGDDQLVKELPKTTGHSMPEVVGGVIIGALLGSTLTFLAHKVGLSSLFYFQ